MRTLTLATAVLATALSGSAFAQQPTTPDGRPIDPSGIQQRPAVTPGTTSSGTIVAPGATVTPGQMILKSDEATAWVGKPIYGSDDKKIGEVAAFARSPNDVVNEMHADIGGILGIGETRVKLDPSQFTLGSDRVMLKMTSTEAKNLPKVAK